MGLISGLWTVVLMTIQHLLCESLALFNCPPKTAAASFCLCGCPNSARPRVGYFGERILGFWTSLVKVPEPKFVDLQGTLHNPSISPGISLTEEYMSCFLLTFSRWQKLMKFCFWIFMCYECSNYVFRFIKFFFFFFFWNYRQVQSIWHSPVMPK